MFELHKVRITNIPTIEAFCQEIFKGPENLVRIGRNSKYTSPNSTDLEFYFEHGH